MGHSTSCASPSTGQARPVSTMARIAARTDSGRAPMPLAMSLAFCRGQGQGVHSHTRNSMASWSHLLHRLPPPSSSRRRYNRVTVHSIGSPSRLAPAVSTVLACRRHAMTDSHDVDGQPRMAGGAHRIPRRMLTAGLASMVGRARCGSWSPASSAVPRWSESPSRPGRSHSDRPVPASLPKVSTTMQLRLRLGDRCPARTSSRSSSGLGIAVPAHVGAALSSSMASPRRSGTCEAGCTSTFGAFMRNEGRPDAPLGAFQEGVERAVPRYRA